MEVTRVLLSPGERTLRARAAAYALHAQGGTSTKAGTSAFLERFTRQVDPDGVLAPEERTRRALLARKSYMTLLAMKAAKAKRLGTKKAPDSLKSDALEEDDAAASSTPTSRS